VVDRRWGALFDRRTGGMCLRLFTFIHVNLLYCIVLYCSACPDTHSPTRRFRRILGQAHSGHSNEQLLTDKRGKWEWGWEWVVGCGLNIYIYTCSRRGDAIADSGISFL